MPDGARSPSSSGEHPESFPLKWHQEKQKLSGQGRCSQSTYEDSLLEHGLGSRLQAENDSKSRDVITNTLNLDFTRERPGSERRPKNSSLAEAVSTNRPNTISARPKPRPPIQPLLFLPQPKPQDSPELKAHMKQILLKNGILTIEGKNYNSSNEDLKYIAELGSGTSGNVVKMLHEPSGKYVAVKQMNRSGNLEETKRVFFDLEVVLKSHDCPYIVRCLGCFVSDTHVWICMELMATCLDKLLKRCNRAIPERILGKISVATVKALHYLKESHGVIHRDVKPSNILLDERGNIKLCDFGISGRLVDSKANTRSAGCAAYMAPERIDPPDPRNPDYDIRADVWSLGITLVELATGRFPYQDCRTDFEVLTKVLDNDPPSLPQEMDFSDEFRSFVKDCLVKDYRQRPKYKKLLEYPFIKKYEKEEVDVVNWFAELWAATAPSETPSSGGSSRIRSSPHRSSRASPRYQQYSSQSPSPQHSITAPAISAPATPAPVTTTPATTTSSARPSVPRRSATPDNHTIRLPVHHSSSAPNGAPPSAAAETSGLTLPLQPGSASPQQQQLANKAEHVTRKVVGHSGASPLHSPSSPSYHHHHHHHHHSSSSSPTTYGTHRVSQTSPHRHQAERQQQPVMESQALSVLNSSSQVPPLPPPRSAPASSLSPLPPPRSCVSSSTSSSLSPLPPPRASLHATTTSAASSPLPPPRASITCTSTSSSPLPPPRSSASHSPVVSSQMQLRIAATAPHWGSSSPSSATTVCDNSVSSRCRSPSFSSSYDHNTKSFVSRQSPSHTRPGHVHSSVLGRYHYGEAREHSVGPIYSESYTPHRDNTSPLGVNTGHGSSSSYSSVHYQNPYMPSRNYCATSKGKQYKGSKTSPVGTLGHNNGSHFSYGVDSISDNSFTNPLILNVGHSSQQKYGVGRAPVDGTCSRDNGGSGGGRPYVSGGGGSSSGGGSGGTLSASSSTTSSSSASFTPPPLRKTPEPVRFNPEPWAPRGRFAQPASHTHFRSLSSDLSYSGAPMYSSYHPWTGPTSLPSYATTTSPNSNATTTTTTTTSSSPILSSLTYSNASPSGSPFSYSRSALVRYPPSYYPPHASPLVSRRLVESRAAGAAAGAAAAVQAQGAGQGSARVSRSASRSRTDTSVSPPPPVSSSNAAATGTLSSPHYRYSQEAYYKSRPYYTPEPQRRSFLRPHQ
ncbi:Protein kinase domain [Trinorchestia longiramus]|nr:Protein kinase domain [Trinorchestia longiramus]